MRIGGLGISEATKWGETPKIQMSAQKKAENAMTDSYISGIQEQAKKDAKAGVYMSEDYVQYSLSHMKRTVSPNRSKSVAQAVAYIQKASNGYGTLLARLLDGYSMKAYVGGFHPTAEVYAPNGEMIAAQTCAGTWIDVQTEAETKLIDASTAVYAEAYSAARAEMKAASTVTTGESGAGVDLRA